MELVKFTANSVDSEPAIDLNTHYIKHPAATFFVRISVDSMIGKGIFPGDLAIIDRSLKAKNGSVIIGALNSEFIIKEYNKVNNKITLKSAHKKHPDISLNEGDEFEIWGVVTTVIHSL